MGETPQTAVHALRKRLNDAKEESLSEAGFVLGPFQQVWKCVRPDGANSVLSILDFLRRCVPGGPATFFVGCEIAVNPVAGYHIEPLPERETLVDRLVIAACELRDKDYRDNDREPNKGPEQGLSALPHTTTLA